MNSIYENTRNLIVSVEKRKKGYSSGDINAISSNFKDLSEKEKGKLLEILYSYSEVMINLIFQRLDASEQKTLFPKLSSRLQQQILQTKDNIPHGYINHVVKELRVLKIDDNIKLELFYSLSAEQMYKLSYDQEQFKFFFDNKNISGDRIKKIAKLASQVDKRYNSFPYISIINNLSEDTKVSVVKQLSLRAKEYFFIEYGCSSKDVAIVFDSCSERQCKMMLSGCDKRSDYIFKTLAEMSDTKKRDKLYSSLKKDVKKSMLISALKMEENYSNEDKKSNIIKSLCRKKTYFCVGTTKYNISMLAEAVNHKKKNKLEGDELGTRLLQILLSQSKTEQSAKNFAKERDQIARDIELFIKKKNKGKSGKLSTSRTSTLSLLGWCNVYDKAMVATVNRKGANNTKSQTNTKPHF